MQSAWRQWGVVTTALLCTVQMADGSVWRFSDATSLDGWDVVGHAVPGPAGLTLSSTNGTAAGVQWAGVPSTGNFTASLAFTHFAVHPSSGSHYEARLQLVVAQARPYNQSSRIGNATRLEINPLVQPVPGGSHSATTYFTLSVGNHTDESSDSPRPVTQLPAGEVLLSRTNGLLSGWYRVGLLGPTPTDVGAATVGSVPVATPWVELSYPTVALPDPTPTTPLYIGVQVDPFYNPAFAVEVPGLQFSADADADGLFDDEEILLGTNPTTADTDGDGLDDFDDVLPLDPAFRWPFPVVPMLGVAAGNASFLTAKLGASANNSGLVLVVNNSRNAPLDLDVTLLGLSAGVVEVVSGSLARTRTSIACALGKCGDTLGPFERVVYQLPVEWDPVLVNPALTASGVSVAGGTAPGDAVSMESAVDLASAVVRPRGQCRWTWTLTKGGSSDAYTAAVNTSGFLTVTRRSPTACALPRNLTVVGAGAECPGVGGRTNRVEAATVNLPVALQGRLENSTVRNGNFETTAIKDPTLIQDWSSYTWQGTFTVTRTTAVAFDTGGAAAELRGWAPGKFGINQVISLPAGTFEVSAMVAAYAAEPGLFGQTFTFLLIVDGGRTIGDITLLPTGATDSGWRPFRGTFTLSESANVTVYFRAWASGYFFVDNVWLARRECGSPRPDKFTLGTEIKPLNFTPPVAFEDLLLCGYCPATHLGATAGSGALHETPVCTRCRTANRTALEPPKQATSQQTLTNYSSNLPPLFIPSACGNVSRPAGTAPPVLVLGQNCFIETDSKVLPSDWSHYAALTFAVTNPTQTPQSIYVEIDDCQSTDYWSRVDYYTYAAPGTETLVVPIDVTVGEKSEIGVYRRPLKLDCITRVAISWQTAGETPTVPANAILELGAMSLRPRAPLVHDFSQLLKIDLQPLAAPVETEFTGYYGGEYSPLRGYGLLPGSAVYQSQDRAHPTHLWRDWIAFESGGIRLDLPAGTFTALLCLVDPGYWEYYQNWQTRQILAEGKVVLNETMSLDQFYAEYFGHEATEDLPGDSSWDRYIAPRYVWKKFDVTVVDGSLDIEFACPTSFGCTVSALIVYPTEQEKVANAFVTELHAAMESRYTEGYLQYIPKKQQRAAATRERAGGPVARAAPNTTVATPAGIVVFQRDSGLDVEAFDTPASTEVVPTGGSLDTVRVSPSTSVAFTFSLLPSASWTGGDIASITLGGLATGLTADISTVRFKQRRMTADGAVWTAAPVLLDPLRPGSPSTALRPETTRRIWCVVTGGAPADLASSGGQSSATVHLTFTGSGIPIVLRLPVVVSSVHLPAAGVWLGYLGMAPLYTETVWPDVAARQQQELGPSLELLNVNGMTAVTGGLGGPVYSGRAPNGTVIMNFSAFDATMNAAAKVFPAVPVNTYGGLNIVGDVSDPEDLTAVATAIAAHIDGCGWPTIYESIADEPADAATIAADDAASAAIAAAKSSNFQSAAFTSFVDANDPRTALANHTSLIILNEHSAASIADVCAKGKHWMLYNSGTRFKRGFYMCRLRALGCRGHYEFAFSSVHADPYYALDSREDDLCAARTSSTLGLLIPEIGLARLGAGTRDFQLCTALQQSITTAPPSPLRDACAATLGRIMNIPVGSEFPEWDPVTVSNVSARVFDCLADLAEP